jgi:hypothetical protein
MSFSMRSHHAISNCGRLARARVSNGRLKQTRGSETKHKGRACKDESCPVVGLVNRASRKVIPLLYLLTRQDHLLFTARSVLEAASRLIKSVDLSLLTTSTKRLTY